MKSEKDNSNYEELRLLHMNIRQEQVYIFTLLHKIHSRIIEVSSDDLQYFLFYFDEIFYRLYLYIANGITRLSIIFLDINCQKRIIDN